MEKTILFICTGNFYRSRFAEAVFNHLAIKRGLKWRAFSRGLAIHLVDGPISPHTLSALYARQISHLLTAPDRQQLSESDLQRADLVIAVKREEHLPMMEKQFPAWASHITYWDVHDLDFAHPEQALPEIDHHLIKLIAQLETQAEEKAPAPAAQQQRPQQRPS